MDPPDHPIERMTDLDQAYYEGQAESKARIAELEARCESYKDGLRTLYERIEQMCRQGSADPDMFEGELAAARAIHDEPDSVREEAREWEELYRKAEARCVELEKREEVVYSWLATKLGWAQETNLELMRENPSTGNYLEKLPRAGAAILERMAELEAERDEARKKLHVEVSGVDREELARVEGSKEPMPVAEMEEAHTWLQVHAPERVRRYLTGWQLGVRSKDRRLDAALELAEEAIDETEYPHLCRPGDPGGCRGCDELSTLRKRLEGLSP